MKLPTFMISKNEFKSGGKIILFQSKTLKMNKTLIRGWDNSISRLSFLLTVINSCSLVKPVTCKMATANTFPLLNMRYSDQFDLEQTVYHSIKLECCWIRQRPSQCNKPVYPNVLWKHLIKLQLTIWRP